MVKIKWMRYNFKVLVKLLKKYGQKAYFEVLSRFSCLPDYTGMTNEKWQLHTGSNRTAGIVGKISKRYLLFLKKGHTIR